MKLQDILLLGTFFLLLYKRNNLFFLYSAYSGIVISALLFVLQIFYTAQHMLYFVAAFLLAAIVLSFPRQKKYYE